MVNSPSYHLACYLTWLLPGIYLVFAAAYVKVALYAATSFVCSLVPHSIPRGHPMQSTFSKIMLGAMFFLFLSSTVQFVLDMLMTVNIAQIFPFYVSHTYRVIVILGHWTTVINVRSPGFLVLAFDF
jgi:hypothetical protein